METGICTDFFNGDIKIISNFKNGIIALPFHIREFRYLAGLMKDELPGSGHKPGKIEIYLVDDYEQSKINQKYLRCSGPTNIISFPSSDSPGILILSIPTFLREALLYGQNAQDYLLGLIAHGLAHLSGYEHGAEMDAICEKCVGKALERLQDGI